MSKTRDILICVGVVIIAVAAIFLMNKIDSKNTNDMDDLYIPSEATSALEETQPTKDITNSVDRVALPDTIYGTVGKPIIIRYLNITGYNSLEDISVVVDSNDKGKVYDDRWEYIPTEAGETTITFTVVDKQGVTVNKSTHLLQIKDQKKAKEISVLVIGDGTIESGYATKKMLDLATADGNKLTLLGTRTATHINDANNRYEGRSGWRASTYLRDIKNADNEAVNPFFNPEEKRFDFSYYMQQQEYSSVDVVCIQLGISDIFGAPTDEALYTAGYLQSYFGNMGIIIDSIHQFDPNIKIVWNLITPGSVEQEKFEIAYGKSQTADQYKKNTYMTNLEIIKNRSDENNVYIASTNAPLDTVNDMQMGGSGGVHPADKGCQDIGTALYNMIMAIVE